MIRILYSKINSVKILDLLLIILVRKENINYMFGCYSNVKKVFKILFLIFLFMDWFGLWIILSGFSLDLSRFV